MVEWTERILSGYRTRRKIRASIWTDWATFGPSWATFEATLDPSITPVDPPVDLKLNRGKPGAKIEPNWAPFGPNWATFGPNWATFDPRLDHLWPIWGHFLEILGGAHGDSFPQETSVSKLVLFLCMS